MLALAPQGVFWTVQGEGILAGEPMIFVRLAGCSVGCAACDTNYSFHSSCSEADVVRQCVFLRLQNNRAKYVWVTGGEPTDQDLRALNGLLWENGFLPCIATAGIRPVVCQWHCLSVSPHGSSFAQRNGTEIKLVPGLNGLDVDSLELDDCEFDHWWVQPMAGSRESLLKCCEFLRLHHRFKMSPQSHKSWVLP